MDELVIARYAEDLGWIRDVPDRFKIVIYNKGKRIADQGVMGRAAAIYNVRNIGRESESYLRHILRAKRNGADFTVFSQGDPFEHSPDFVALLGERDRWHDLQPLSWRYQASQGLPPAELLEHERADFLGSLRIRKEIYSLHTMAPVQFTDEGALAISAVHRTVYGLPEGTNVVADFLDRAGLAERAAEARSHRHGSFAYGAIFAVRNRLLSSLPNRAYQRLRKLSRHKSNNGWMLERIWLHLWGEPFLEPLDGEPVDDEPVDSHRPEEPERAGRSAQLRTAHGSRATS